MSEAIIRTLRRDDYPALIDLVRRTWYAEFDERTGLLAAKADWENCLARTTNAFVAELDGQPVALIVGRVDALDHRSPLNSHRINSWNALARLVFAKGGIKAAGEILGILGIDKRLRAQAASAGHDYAAEVVLFVLDPAARGHGAGPAHVRDADGRVPPGRRARLLPVHGHHMRCRVLCASRPDAGVRAVTARIRAREKTRLRSTCMRGRCPSRRDVPAVGQTLVGLSTSWYAGIPSTGRRRRG